MIKYVDGQPVEMTAEEIAEFEAGRVPMLSVANFHAALYEHFDATAQADRWDNRNTLMQRAAFPGRWQALALAFCAWVNDCEVAALEMLSQVEAGEVAPPESVDAFIAALPAWEAP